MGQGEVLREGVRLIDKAADLADEAPGLVRCLGFRLQGGLLAADGGGQGPGQGLQLLVLSGGRVDFRVTGASSSSMSFMPHRISDMSLPLAGAQEPFWMRATLRPRRAWWARSRRKLSMETKMPLL